MENGFIKLHRSLLTWEWFNNGNTFRLFIYLLLKANWKDGTFQGKIIPSGSLITGRRELAKQLKMSEQEIRTALTHLKNSGEITIKTTNKYSLITIEKWAFYQGTANQINPQNNPYFNPQANHNIRNKEFKNNVSNEGMVDMESVYSNLY